MKDENHKWREKAKGTKRKKWNNGRKAEQSKKKKKPHEAASWNESNGEYRATITIDIYLGTVSKLPTMEIVTALAQCVDMIWRTGLEPY